MSAKNLEKLDLINNEKYFSQSDIDLLNMKKSQSYSVIETDEKKSENSLDISNNNQNKEENESFTNLINLSKLYKSYMHRNTLKGDTIKRRRSIFFIPRLNKSVSIKDTEQLLNPDFDDNISLNNIIKEKISEAKGDLIQYLEETKNKLESKYNNFINNINKLLMKKEKQISKILVENAGGDNFIDYANNNLFKQLDDILEIHNYIFNALEDLFNILSSLLEQSSLINQKKPIEYFIYNNISDILNSWLLNKFDCHQIDLSRIISNKKHSEIVTGYFSKMKNNEYSSISLNKYNKQNFPLEVELFKKNINNVKKINLIGLSQNEIIKINEEINEDSKNKWNTNFKIEAKKARNLSIIKCIFKSNSPLKISFPILKTFVLKDSFMPTSYLFDYILKETNSLVKIHLENINLIDKDLKIFFKYLSKKNIIQNNLKSLSFKGNNLTKISLDNFNTNNNLENLQLLNFSKNNIYELSEKIFRLVPNLDVIDLTDNNLSNKILFDFCNERKKVFKFMALLSNNIFIHNNSNNNLEYIKYISEKLSTFQNTIKKISFCLLFNQNNLSYLSKLKISPAAKISLIKLDLSFCSLNNENILAFLKNNFGLLNLEVLNLSNNYLTINLFDSCNGTKGEILLEKIIVLDLSFNEINLKEIESLHSLENFINSHTNLKKIKLQGTSFLDDFKTLSNSLDFNDEANFIIQRLMSRNLKFVLETVLNNSNAEFLSNLLSFKDKTY